MPRRRPSWALPPGTQKNVAATAELLQREAERLDRHTDRLDRLPAAGMDRAGMPAIDELVRFENSALKRVSPRWRRWTEILELDEAIAELEREHTTIGERLADVRQRLQTAPALDAQAAGRWIASGRKGEAR